MSLVPPRQYCLLYLSSSISIGWLSIPYVFMQMFVPFSFPILTFLMSLPPFSRDPFLSLSLPVCLRELEEKEEEEEDTTRSKKKQDPKSRFSSSSEGEKENGTCSKKVIHYYYNVVLLVYDMPLRSTVQYDTSIHSCTVISLIIWK